MEKGLNSFGHGPIRKTLFPNPDYTIQPLVSKYNQPPIDGSLQNWANWLTSNKNGRCYVPNWEKAMISEFPSASFGKKTLNIRHVLITPGNYYGSDYLFRIYIDTVWTHADRVSYYGVEREDWWSKLDTVKFVIRYVEPMKSHSDYEFTIDGCFMHDTVTFEMPETGVNKWIKSTKSWQFLSKRNGLGESVLPNLHSIWSEISEKTITDAESYLKDKKNNAHSVELFGISISFLFVLIAIPLAFLLLNISLLMHVKYLNDYLPNLKEYFVFPWVGIYQFTLARVVEYLTLLLLPTSICIGLVIRFQFFESFIKSISILLTVATFYTGILLLRANRETRLKINVLFKKQ